MVSGAYLKVFVGGDSEVVLLNDYEDLRTNIGSDTLDSFIYEIAGVIYRIYCSDTGILDGLGKSFAYETTSGNLEYVCGTCIITIEDSDKIIGFEDKSLRKILNSLGILNISSKESVMISKEDYHKYF